MSSFEEKLQTIKYSEEQTVLMSKERNSWWCSISLAVLAGICFSLSFFLYSALGLLLSIIAFVCGVVLILNADSVLHNSAVEGKKQDRKYFVECIRSADNLQQLYDAGLFGFLNACDNEELLVKVNEHRDKLIVSLSSGEVNDT